MATASPVACADFRRICMFNTVVGAVGCCESTDSPAESCSQYTSCVNRRQITSCAGGCSVDPLVVTWYRTSTPSAAEGPPPLTIEQFKHGFAVLLDISMDCGHVLSGMWSNVFLRIRRGQLFGPGYSPNYVDHFSDCNGIQY